jgi:hypothetical protein
VISCERLEGYGAPECKLFQSSAKGTSISANSRFRVEGNLNYVGYIRFARARDKEELCVVELKILHLPLHVVAESKRWAERGGRR